MTAKISEQLIKRMRQLLKGDVFVDDTTLLIYSTDASAYQEKPLAVIRPRDIQDLRLLMPFVRKHQLPVIMRGAGTSLAGQVVGKGIVVDVSAFLNRIIDVNAAERWVIVEPGVVLDELNRNLKQHGLFFGPETSTSNRCTIGGMVGNNSCGSHSLVYGSTRDHLLEVHGLLSDGEEIVIKPLTLKEWQQKCSLVSLEGDIYRFFKSVIEDEVLVSKIHDAFPHPQIHRRNTGYAIDLVAKRWAESGLIDLTQIIAGSEGTLMVITKVKLGLVPLPPSHTGLLCIHLRSFEEAVRANLEALSFMPVAVELMDKKVLDLTRQNIVQRQNRFFIEGDPESLLLVEFAEQSIEEINKKSEQLITALQKLNLGYAFPLLLGKDIKRVWDLRKAGLGVLSNMPGDDLPVPVIEDTAVRVEDMGLYLREISEMLQRYNKDCVFYGHIGSGELHLRPVLNMKNSSDIKLFREIATATAQIVKKFRGSLSGEHGDGRLRGEFIPMMVGEEVYPILKQIKLIFDPAGILNPGKIVDTPPMDHSLRYGQVIEGLPLSRFSWHETDGWVRGAERCNGAADCRKSSVIGGVMCPSFMAGRNEKDSTRARANVLRQYFTGNIQPTREGMEQVLEILDLCLSCKACKAECPSNVDMAKLKAEFLNYYHQQQGASFRDRLIARQPQMFQMASMAPKFYNLLLKSHISRKFIARVLSLDENTPLPLVVDQTLRKWFDQNSANGTGSTVAFFADEFTNFTADASIGKKTVLMLQCLGYHVIMPMHRESGRTWLSKGFLDRAAEIARYNVSVLSDVVSSSVPLIGIEPSAILTFRDEYPDLVGEELRDKAVELSNHVYTIEEFLWKEMSDGKIQRSQFTSKKVHICFHAHCYQKALSDSSLTQKILSFPDNYSAETIDAGCCGMAGAFGYEAEHAAFAKRVGELKLFPKVRQTPQDSYLVASGTSCRSHIHHHTGRKLLHPVEILFDALIEG